MQQKNGGGTRVRKSLEGKIFREGKTNFPKNPGGINSGLHYVIQVIIRQLMKVHIFGPMPTGQFGPLNTVSSLSVSPSVV